MKIMMTRFFPNSLISPTKLAETNQRLDDILVSLTMKNEKVSRSEAETKVKEVVEARVERVLAGMKH